MTATPRSRPMTAQNPTAQSFILPDLPNLTELVSGVFEDGTPVFSKTAPVRTQYGAPGKGGRQPSHIPVDSVPIPKDEKAIFAALQLLQDKVAQMEHERAEQEKKIEEQELEIVELKATAQAQAQARGRDSALGSTDGEGSSRASWKVEKTRKSTKITFRFLANQDQASMLQYRPSERNWTVQNARLRLSKLKRNASAPNETIWRAS